MYKDILKFEVVSPVLAGSDLPPQLAAAMAHIKEILNENTAKEISVPELTAGEEMLLVSAISLLEEHIERHGVREEYVYKLGKMYERLGKYQDAKIWYERGASMYASNTAFPQDSSRMAVLLGNYEDCQYFARLAVQRDPDNAVLHDNLAIALLLNGHVEDAYEEAALSDAIDSEGSHSNEEKKGTVRRAIELVMDRKAPRPDTYEKYLAIVDEVLV